MPRASSASDAGETLPREGKRHASGDGLHAAAGRKAGPMSEEQDGISFRPLVSTDISVVPLSHQGEPDEVRQRIADLGASAMLAFDGAQHVGQLQFRRYEPGTHSPKGLWDPLYWADFAGHAPDLPARTLVVFCYHVGQLDDTDARDPRYQGRGLGLRLLDHFLAWATEAGFAAVVAKAVPPYRPIMLFMGGQPASVYQARGFEIAAHWIDPELQAIVEDRSLIPEKVLPADAVRVSCCVRRLR
jgi:GNAT superfamily N-acetyltransferase